MSIKTTLHATAPLLYPCRRYPKCPWGLYASPPPVAMAVVGWFVFPRLFFGKKAFFSHTRLTPKKKFMRLTPKKQNFRRKKTRLMPPKKSYTTYAKKKKASHAYFHNRGTLSSVYAVCCDHLNTTYTTQWCSQHITHSRKWPEGKRQCGTLGEIRGIAGILPTHAHDESVKSFWKVVHVHFPHVARLQPKESCVPPTGVSVCLLGGGGGLSTVRAQYNGLAVQAKHLMYDVVQAARTMYLLLSILHTVFAEGKMGGNVASLGASLDSMS